MLNVNQDNLDTSLNILKGVPEHCPNNIKLVYMF